MYVDTNLVGSGNVSKAAIVGLAGGVWASSPGYTVRVPRSLELWRPTDLSMLSLIHTPHSKCRHDFLLCRCVYARPPPVLNVTLSSVNRGFAPGFTDDSFQRRSSRRLSTRSTSLKKFVNTAFTSQARSSSFSAPMNVVCTAGRG